jgi:hypothetical protein
MPGDFCSIGLSFYSITSLTMAGTLRPTTSSIHLNLPSRFTTSRCSEACNYVQGVINKRAGLFGSETSFNSLNFSGCAFRRGLSAGFVFSRLKNTDWIFAGSRISWL